MDINKIKATEHAMRASGASFALIACSNAIIIVDQHRDSTTDLYAALMQTMRDLPKEASHNIYHLLIEASMSMLIAAFQFECEPGATKEVLTRLADQLETVIDEQGKITSDFKFKREH